MYACRAFFLFSTSDFCFMRMFILCSCPFMDELRWPIRPGLTETLAGHNVAFLRRRACHSPSRVAVIPLHMSGESHQRKNCSNVKGPILIGTVPLLGITANARTAAPMPHSSRGTELGRFWRWDRVERTLRKSSSCWHSLM